MLMKRIIGLYEQQDDNQEEHNLRGKFVTDSNGEYSLYCLRPTPYPVSTRARWSTICDADDLHADPQ